MLILRLGNDGSLLGIPAYVNLYLLTYATTFGFFLIASVQLIGILMSEISPVKVGNGNGFLFQNWNFSAKIFFQKEKLVKLEMPANLKKVNNMSKIAFQKGKFFFRTCFLPWVDFSATLDLEVKFLFTGLIILHQTFCLYLLPWP